MEGGLTGHSFGMATERRLVVGIMTLLGFFMAMIIDQ